MRFVIILIIVLGLTVSSILSFSATINVPADQPSIQAGIDMASNGDTILIAQGIYNGEGNQEINIIGKRLVLKSNGLVDSTIIGDNSLAIVSYALNIQDVVDSGLIIDGIHFMAFMNSEHGLISIENSVVVFKNCIINENHMAYAIRSIDTAESSVGKLYIDSCNIFDNLDTNITVSNCYLKITNSRIGNGGQVSVYIRNSNYTEIRKTFFLDGYEYAFLADSIKGDLIIENCTFQGGGDAITVFNYTGTGVQDISIAQNNITYVDRGIRAESIDPANIVCNNAYGCFVEAFNTGGNGAGDVYGNISVDPLYCGPNSGFYTLVDGSPCLPSNNSCGVLIGAFDRGCVAELICGDANRDGLINIIDVVFMIDYLYNNGPRPPVPHMSNVSGDGVINILDLTYLIAYLYQSGPEPDCL